MLNPEINKIKRLVSGRLNLQAAGSHPHADQLTAFAERTISDQDRNSLLEHMAACRDCREVLYLSLPDHAEIQQVHAYTRKRPRFAIGWATLAASLVIVGSIVITNRDAVEHKRSVNEPSATAAGANAPGDQYSTRDQISQNRPLQPAETSAAPVAEARLKTRPLEKHMTAKPQRSLQFDQTGEVHFTGNSANEVEHLAAAPQAPAPSQAEKASQATASQSAGLDAQAKQVQARTIASGANLAAPLWRVSNGTPQRSLDGGQSWQAAFAPSGTFRAVSSLGQEIWLGGVAGLLYHSSDFGQNWARTSPSVGDRKLESDITQISFTDALTGTVSTVNGQVWSTSDGGQSWRVK